MKRYLLPVFGVVALVVGGAGAWVANGNESPTPAAAVTSGGASAQPAPAVVPSATNLATVAGVAPIPTAGTAPDPGTKPVPALPAVVDEVVKLSRSSVGESVLLSYIGTIQEPFTLDADQIIYLSDIGFGTPVLNALLSKAASSPAVSGGTPVNLAVPGAVVPANTFAPAGNPPTNPPLSSVIPGGPQPAASAPVYGEPTAPSPTAATPVTAVAPGQAVVTETFYQQLSPYGSWVQLEPYGWCWQPTVVVVNTAWQPYCDGGHWVWSDYGWYWQSTYSWGWAPFHYGRWHHASRLGWVWTPGRDWGPAWVAWRNNDRYCGWAPLPPECHWSVGVGYSWRHSRGTSVSVGFGISDDWWFACSWGRFTEPVLAPHGLRRHEIAPFVRESRAIYSGDKSVNIVGNNNTVIINNGVSREQVQAHTRGEIRKVAIRDVSSGEAAAQRPVSRGNAASPEVGVFRPNLAASPARRPGAAAPVAPGRSEATRPNAPATSGGPAALPSRPGQELRAPKGPATPPNQGSVPSRPAAPRAPTPPPNPGSSGGGSVPSRGTAASGFSAPVQPSPGVARPSQQGAANVPAVRQDPAVIRQVPTTRTEVRKPEASGGGPVAPGAGVGYEAPQRVAPTVPTVRSVPGYQGRPDSSPLPVVRPDPRPTYNPPTPAPTVTRPYTPPPAPAPAPAPYLNRPRAPGPAPSAPSQPQGSTGGGRSPNPGQPRGRDNN